jgi:DNA polymerase V
MRAIVDCNSFYCSCERVFRPDLWNKPVVVLSNNDGCIISISKEAKSAGITMATPFFLAKEIIEKNNIAVFSSNYNLYGDLSRRVMDTLKHLVGKDNVEVYSVDEAFLDLSSFPIETIEEFSLEIKETVEAWTGVAVSIGVGATKTLAKVANRLAKKIRTRKEGVLVLKTQQQVDLALEQTAVGDIWGVGRQYANKLRDDWNIYTAQELSLQNEAWAKKYLGGVVGVRLVQELKGIESIMMDDELDNKKMIATTRMFGTPVTELKDIKEAVATYTSRAAEKLRRQQSAAGVISVFVVPKEEKKAGERFRHGPMRSTHKILDKPTAFTQELIKPALILAERLFEKGQLYKKAGVMLSHFVPDTTIQGNLFLPETKNASRHLMNMIDNVNFSMRDDVIKFASSGTTRNWKMRQEHRSKRYTTRWEELFEVF